MRWIEVNSIKSCLSRLTLYNDVFLNRLQCVQRPSLSQCQMLRVQRNLAFSDAPTCTFFFLANCSFLTRFLQGNLKGVVDTFPFVGYIVAGQEPMLCPLYVRIFCLQLCFRLTMAAVFANGS
jgi:hypothetical protein